MTACIDQQVGIITWQLAEPGQSGEFLHYIFTVIFINTVLWDPPQQTKPMNQWHFQHTSSASLLTKNSCWGGKKLVENNESCMYPYSCLKIQGTCMQSICILMNRPNAGSCISTSLCLQHYISIKMTGSSEKLSWTDKLIHIDFLLCKIAIFSFLPGK